NRPLTPAGLSAIRLIGSSAARLLGLPVGNPLEGPAAYKEIGQRVFLDLTKTLRGSVGRTLLPRIFDVMEARSAAVLRKLAEDPRLSLERRSWLPFLRRALKFAISNGIPAAALKGLTEPKETLKCVEKVGADLVQRIRPREIATSME